MFVNPNGLYVGMMSGTSTDGIDAVVAHIDQEKIELYEHAFLPFSPSFQAALISLNQPTANELHQSQILSREWAGYSVRVIHQLLQKSRLSPQDIVAIGVHGQTVRHRPDCGYTVQLNYPGYIAQETQIPVIADFRSTDVALGGQGAPFAPLFHRVLFGVGQIVVNLGGIANVSILDTPVRGFDTGPANVLMDAWIDRHLHQSHDHQGQWGAQGQVHEDLLQFLIRSEPWFEQVPPKSTGRDLFHLAWLESRLQDFGQNVSAVDVQATLRALTAQTVIDAILPYCSNAQTLVLCGGGVKNSALVHELQQRLPVHLHITSSDEVAYPSDTVESLGFAYLAWAFMQQQKQDTRYITGASKPHILGAYYPV